ncbi:AAA family ATPase [uncultured Desulfobacter sp.]|uniref:AAA family ATPase n=1 Tax=uncultured Desulfobacter sp. TaxID=240139 RepID=UPI002AA940B0|nr:AAA family ATPase [uncultured Desulfobacter sp.]
MENKIEDQIPMIFLCGPPGSGKTTVGAKACQNLELRFIDLSTPEIDEKPLSSQKEICMEAINNRSADVIALPWSFQEDRSVRKWIRSLGALLLLWAHPLDMQARSGRSEPLFTPSPRIKTKGGFGRNGTGCREFRRLNNAADEVLLLIGRSLDEAVDDLEGYIVDIRQEALEPPMVRAGLSDWVDDWYEDYDVRKDIINIVVDAMARYILYLQSEGKSPRTLSGVYSDLQASGMLVMSYDYPEEGTTSEILDLFSFPPWTIEFKRKFSNSPNAIARYERNLEGFANFLKSSK